MIDDVLHNFGDARLEIVLKLASHREMSLD
jgi:hypothetical protein